jgi:hypothetical protein
MSSGTTNGGLTELGAAGYTNHAAYTLVAYTNAVGTLSASSVAADLSVIVTSNGYAPITLTAANWTSAAGVVTYLPSPVWTATGSWSGTVNGVAIIYGAILMHWWDFDGVAPNIGPWVASNARKLQPNLTTVL